ncbi:MAG: ArsR/SmtB family transcription factor [Candidatus Zixiibacteriota bacterium]
MATGREVKDRLYEQFARIGRAVASPKRLELLDLLCQCEKTVEVLATQASLSVANTSRHLQILRGAHLIEGRREGLHVYYRLADEKVCEFFRSLRHLADSRLAEIDRIVSDYFDNRNKLQPIDRKRLLKKAKSGELLVLDVRPYDEFLSGHLPKARSMPLPELKDRLEELPSDQEIVAYCRGPYCVLAREAVRFLRAKGFKAVRLEDGVAEWRKAGLPVVTGQKGSSRKR